LLREREHAGVAEGHPAEHTAVGPGLSARDAHTVARDVDAGRGERGHRGWVDADRSGPFGDFGSLLEHDDVGTALREEHRGEHADGASPDYRNVTHRTPRRRGGGWGMRVPLATRWARPGAVRR